MAKQKIKKGDNWKHKPSGERIKIVKTSKIKLPHAVVGNSWFPAVTYKNDQGEVFNRFLDDFVNKYEFESKKTKKNKKNVSAA